MSLLDRHIEKREGELEEAKAVPKPINVTGYLEWQDNVSRKQGSLTTLLVLKAGIDPDSEEWK